jgi:hypothetical protein
MRRTTTVMPLLIFRICPVLLQSLFIDIVVVIFTKKLICHVILENIFILIIVDVLDLDIVLHISCFVVVIFVIHC